MIPIFFLCFSVENLPNNIAEADRKASTLRLEPKRLQDLESNLGLLKKIQEIQKKIALTRHVANTVSSAVLSRGLLLRMPSTRRNTETRRCCVLEVYFTAQSVFQCYTI